MTIRIGSRVKKIVGGEEVKAEGRNYTYWKDILSKEAGTVIAVNREENSYDDDIHKSYTVRWDTGAIIELDINEAEDITENRYANIYIHNRAYGGPEEGGWWYDTMTPFNPQTDDFETKPPAFGLFDSEGDAEKAAEALADWCETENQNRRDVSSVLSDGVFVVEVEAWPSEQYPSSRPHYC